VLLAWCCLAVMLRPAWTADDGAKTKARRRKSKSALPCPCLHVKTERDDLLIMGTEDPRVGFYGFVKNTHGLNKTPVWKNSKGRFMHKTPNGWIIGENLASTTDGSMFVAGRNAAEAAKSPEKMKNSWMIRTPDGQWVSDSTAKVTCHAREACEVKGGSGIRGVKGTDYEYESDFDEDPPPKPREEDPRYEAELKRYKDEQKREDEHDPDFDEKPTHKEL